MCFVFFIYMTVINEKNKLRLTLFYISIVFLTFGLFEAYLWSERIPTKKSEYSKNIINYKHDILGTAPVKSSVAHHTKKHGDELDFDVMYSIDSDGLRISQYRNIICKESIIFFGGSFTFGSGVNDDEALPFRVATYTNNEYCVYNFGFRGYGPHQMLSALEHDLVDSIITTKPVHIIYQAITEHIIRVDGLTTWSGKYEPKYSLNNHGHAVYSGHFDKKERSEPRDFSINKSITLLLRNQLFKSFIGKNLYIQYTESKKYTEENMNLFAEVVSSARSIVESRYSNCKFHVLFWDNKKRDINKDIIREFDRKALNVHLMSEILPDYYGKRRNVYSISKYDQHPSPLAYKIIAEYVTNKIIKYD